MSEARRELFDRWAESYDDSVKDEGFPFEGYERVLDLVAERAKVEAGASVLDLGVGTGNLARRFVALGCDIWGMDFSCRMLAKARERLPGVELMKADILGDWPIDVDKRFDSVVSGYVMHEFDFDSKIRLLQKLARQHLAPGARIVVGDVSFNTARERDEANKRYLGDWDEETQTWKDGVWDEDEHYWAADETIAALAGVDLSASYEQVSFCGGVYVVERAGTGGPSEAGS